MVVGDVQNLVFLTRSEGLAFRLWQKGTKRDFSALLPGRRHRQSTSQTLRGFGALDVDEAPLATEERKRGYSGKFIYLFGVLLKIKKWEVNILISEYNFYFEILVFLCSPLYNIWFLGLYSRGITCDLVIAIVQSLFCIVSTSVLYGFASVSSLSLCYFSLPCRFARGQQGQVAILVLVGQGSRPSS